MSTLTILRTDTVFAKLPIHTLAKSTPINIRIDQTNAQGIQELSWSVSPSSDYGPPQLLAYKLDTLVINRHLDALRRPLPSLICLGSLRQIYQDLGQSRGKSTRNLKRAFHQNAGVYITAKLYYRDRVGKQRRLEAGFHRYGVIFTGESLPHGSMADAVYISLHESYRQVLNLAPTRPIDYDYLVDLKPLAQRFYELLSFKMFAALKYQHPQVSMRYSEFSQFAPQRRYLDGERMRKQMHRVHQPHLQSGYLAAVQKERVSDAEGHPDWLLHYIPGPKAQAEYQAFTGPYRKRQSSVPETARSDRSEFRSLEPAPTDGRTDPATILVQQFHSMLHSVDDKVPRAKEIEHANHLFKKHGGDFSEFFVRYACQAARKQGFHPDFFGGLMSFEDAALWAYHQQQARQVKALAEQAEAREMELRQVYERDCQGKLAAYEAGLEPEALASFKEQIRTELIAREDIAPVALKLELRLELDQRLLILADLPSFEDWLSRQQGDLRCYSSRYSL